MIPALPIIGQGSFGKVEKVCWCDKIYARKTLLHDEERDEGLSFASLRESDIYSRFACNFMARVYRVTLENHQICLWMGLADSSLAQYIETNPPFNDRLALMPKVAWAVLNFFNYLHTYNVLHRDIKPDNILLNNNDNNNDSDNNNRIGQQVYVTDMGSCRYIGSGRSTGNCKMTGGMGTKCYRPPEMNGEHYGKPADVYCLGCTLIHLLHGIHPVEGFNPETYPSHWQQTLLAYNQHIPANLYNLLHRMILTDPTKRITITEALQHDFFQINSIPQIPKMLPVPKPGLYMSKLGMTAEERTSWVEYIVDVGTSYSCNHTTIATAVQLWDDFLFLTDSSTISRHTEQLKQNALELHATVCLWISTKYLEEHALRLCDLLYQCQGRFQISDFTDMEECIIVVLNYRIIRRPLPRSITNKLNPFQLKQILSSNRFLVKDE